jgi:hypothetical protein
MLPQRLFVPESDATVSAPAKGAGMPAGTGWLDRYRNRVLLWAIFYTVAFIPFMGSFYAPGLMKDVYIGILAGLVFFALSGQRIWRGFDMTPAMENDQKTRPEGYGILFLVIGIVLGGVALLVMASLSIIPLEMALALPAVATGFAFIPWYVLLLVLLWERRRGCILIFDKKTLSLTRKRCSINA